MSYKNKIVISLLAGIIILLPALIVLIYKGIFSSKTTNKCAINIENNRLPNNALLDSESGNNFYDRLHNEKVLLIFLTTDCGGCQIESRIVSKALPLIGSKVKIYGVVREEKDKVQNFVKNYNVNFPILVDKDGKMFEQLKIRCTPMNLIIENGEIKKVLTGSPKDEKMLLSDLEIAN